MTDSPEKKYKQEQQGRKIGRKSGLSPSIVFSLQWEKFDIFRGKNRRHDAIDKKWPSSRSLGGGGKAAASAGL
jgi:hypothetical protein